MRIETKPIKELKQDEDNARKHDERNLKAIEESLEEFGQQKPIVVNKEGIVIAGNGTLEAAKRIGWETIQVVKTELEGHHLKAYAIADNRSAEIARWDDEVLARTMEELANQDEDLALSLGFDEAEIRRLVERVKEVEELEAPDWANTETVDVDAGVQKVMLTFTSEEYANFEKAITELKESRELADTTSVVISVIEEVSGHAIS